MRKNRFYLEREFNDQSLELTDQSIIRQIKTVLRLKVGESFFLFNSQGLELEVKIKDFKKQSIELFVVNREKKRELTPEVCLYLAILKKENFELAVQKAVEAGVKKIIPLITERTVKLGLKAERLKLIIKEASEQSGRSVIPELREPINFTEAISLVGGKGSFNLFCDLLEDQGNKIDFPKTVLGPINIFIGPEGGWSSAEQELARLEGLQLFSLGSYVLRAETAAIIATWLAVNKKL